MRRLISLIIIGFFLSILLVPSYIAVEDSDNSIIIGIDSYEAGYRYNIQGWVYLHIEGDAYDRGYQYGYLLADEILDNINRWNDVFPPSFSWAIQRLNAMRLFWNKYPEEYKQEIHGIADGMNDKGVKIDGEDVTYKDILALNEIFELRSRTRFPPSPLRDLFYGVPSRDAPDSPLTSHTGHCSAFLATGDATVDGNIVATQATWGDKIGWGSWNHYLAERYNLILDIKPTNGHRVIMTTAPGYIWSMEDYYQNDAGMILMETTICGFVWRWNRFGTPVSIRLRSAIQYCDSIDGIIDCILNKNNGLYSCDWMIGDTKTGEIASLELGLRNHALTRTKNGFLWSCNNAKDPEVIREVNSIFGFGIIGTGFYQKTNDKFFVYDAEFIPSDRDLKFQELKEKYYGEIDIDVAKHIMSTYPLYYLSTDTKITDTDMVEDIGFWAFMGSPDGSDFMPSNDEDYIFSWPVRDYTDMPACGWTKIYAGTSLNEKNHKISENTNNIIKNNGKLIKEFKNSPGFYESDAIYSSPVIIDGVLYASSWSGDIIALDVETGNRLWQTKIGDLSMSTPLVVEDIIFVGSNNGLYSISAKDGKILWKNELRAVTSTPAYHNDIVFCGSHDDKVYAFDSRDGDLIWSVETDGEIYSSPTIADGLVLIGSNDNNLYAIDYNNGEIKWTYETEGIIDTKPFVCNNRVFFGSWDNNLYALELKTGKLIWKYKTGWGIESSPIIYDDILYFGSNDNNLYALNPTNGEKIWSFTAGSAIHSSPTVYGEYVFFGCDDGRLYAVEKTSGEIAWAAAPDYYINSIQNYVTKPIVSSLEVYDGDIYFCSTNGKIYSYDSQTFEPEIKEEKKEETKLDIGLIILITVTSMLIMIAYIYLRKNKKK